MKAIISAALIATANAVSANISAVTVTPPVAKYAAAELIKFNFEVTIAGLSNQTFIDCVVEVCRPKFPGDCEIFKGGHLPPTAGEHAALAKVPTDASWWTVQHEDLPVGTYGSTLYVCDGACEHWFKKPVVLASFASSFVVSN